MVPNQIKNLNIPLLLSSKSKGGSMTDVRAESAKYILGKWDLYLHKNHLHLVFNKEKLKYYHYYRIFIIDF